MQTSFRSLQLTPVLCLLACTAPWGRVVKYSPDAADHSVIVEVYRAVLATLTEEPGPDSVAVQHFGDPAPLLALTTLGGLQVPGHWADTLKHEVRIALSHLDRSKLADSADIRLAGQTLGLVLLPSDTTEWPLNRKRPPPPRIRLSRPGFNGDSTIAALRMDMWCGPLCGSGETLLLARKPGNRWRVWHAFGHWRS
jgi:hypothetical protein